jgi:transposase-like protein
MELAYYAQKEHNTNIVFVRNPLAQHFLLSAAARTLSLKATFSQGEAVAYRRFCQLRWPETEGAPVCPDCECIEVYDLASRRRFKCAACYRQFSVTSGTIFASRKLSFTDLLGAICLFVNASKGMSAVQLSRDLNVQYKTAFVLMHKLREAIAAETAEMKLANTVEIDGAYFGGHVRPANFKEDRVDRRLLRNRTGKRRVVVVLRERSGRTLTRAFLREAEGVNFAKNRIEPGSVVTTDEAAHWDLLAPAFDTHRINHSDAYSRDGIHTNMAESYFSRLRRMIRGQHHRVGVKYLGSYAAHAAWLGDHRMISNGGLADRLIGNALAIPVSGAWKGYWQGAG